MLALFALSARELACHALPTTVFAGQGLFALPVDDRHKPSQTVGSGTQRARMNYVGGSDLAVRGWTGLRGRSALQVLGSARAALDRLPRGAEQAASGESCG